MDRYRKEKPRPVFHPHLINSNVYNCVLLNFQFAVSRSIDADYGDLKDQGCLLISVNKSFLLSLTIEYQPQ